MTIGPIGAFCLTGGDHLKRQFHVNGCYMLPLRKGSSNQGNKQKERANAYFKRMPSFSAKLYPLPDELMRSHNLPIL